MSIQQVETERDREIRFFHTVVQLKRGEKMPHALGYVPDDVQLTIGDKVDVDLETLRLADYQRLTQHEFSQWKAYLTENHLTLELSLSDAYNFDLFTVTEELKQVGK